MDQASQKVTSALIQTLNNDNNVNVRLAALDALRVYSGEGKVREELIRSIAKQDSPLVQIALAELMAQLQAKSSVKELEKILKNENTPADVKKKIEQSLKVLV
jgi:DNA polymerase III delta subunit